MSSLYQKLLFCLLAACGLFLLVECIPFAVVCVNNKDCTEVNATRCVVGQCQSCKSHPDCEHLSSTPKCSVGTCVTCGNAKQCQDFYNSLGKEEPTPEVSVETSVPDARGETPPKVPDTPPEKVADGPLQLPGRYATIFTSPHPITVTDIEVDPQNNAYIIGHFKEELKTKERVATGLKDDFYLFIAKLNADGKVMWLYRYMFRSLGAALTILSDGNIVAIGTSRQKSKADRHCLFLKLTQDKGDPRGEYVLPSSVFCEGTDVITDATGRGFYVLLNILGGLKLIKADGKSAEPRSGAKSDFLIGHMNTSDKLGTFTWFEHSENAGQIEGKKLRLGKNKGLFVSGYFKNGFSYPKQQKVAFPKQDNKNVFILRLESDNSHKPDWAFQFGSVRDEQVHDFELTSGEAPLIVGYFDGAINVDKCTNIPEPLNKHFMFVLLGNVRGKCVGFQYPSTREKEATSELSSISVDPEGNVYTAGKYTHNISFGGQTFASTGNRAQSKLLLMMWNKGGAFIWSESLGDGGNIHDVRLRANGASLFIVGSYSKTINLEGSAYNHKEAMFVWRRTPKPR